MFIEKSVSAATKKELVIIGVYNIVDGLIKVFSLGYLTSRLALSYTTGVVIRRRNKEVK